MNYKKLAIFVEGPDDEYFVEKVIKPFLTEKYNDIKIVKYSRIDKQKLKNWIQTYQRMPNCDYIFFCDFDSQGNKSYCVTKRKQKALKMENKKLDLNKIMVVKEEIESWYLAGIVTEKAKEFKLKEKLFLDTAKITKEAFEKLIPKKFLSKTDFMVEILKTYDFAKAKKCNASLAYFERKFMS